MSRKASGFKAWLVQRVSAIYLGLYVLYLLMFFAFGPIQSYAEYRAWLSSPVSSLMMMIFFLALLLHAWIGVRDVVIDYVHPLSLRLAMLSCIALLLIACGFWVLRTLVLVAL